MLLPALRMGRTSPAPCNLRSALRSEVKGRRGRQERSVGRGTSGPPILPPILPQCTRIQVAQSLRPAPRRFAIAGPRRPLQERDQDVAVAAEALLRLLQHGHCLGVLSDAIERDGVDIDVARILGALVLGNFKDGTLTYNGSCTTSNRLAAPSARAPTPPSGCRSAVGVSSCRRGTNRCGRLDSSASGAVLRRCLPGCSIPSLPICASVDAGAGSRTAARVRPSTSSSAPSRPECGGCSRIVPATSTLPPWPR